MLRKGCPLWATAVLLLSRLPLPGVDRCADARDDIRRAKGMADAGQVDRARTLLRSAFFACPAHAQNLELLADAYDSIDDFAQASAYRAQAWRVKGVSSKPSANLTTSRTSVEKGETVTLSWTTAYATEVEITPDPGRVGAKGSRVVAPASSSSYQLTARGPGGTTTASVQITVTVPRLTEASIRELLENEVPQPRIAQLAAERGIAFIVTADTEQRLRDIGAEDALIAALKKAAQ